MNLNNKNDKIKKLDNMDFLRETSTVLSFTDFNEIKLSVFELKEAIKRLEQYLYYSDLNPFSKNVSYINYARFIYESYLNDAYIIQTRFRKVINSIKKENRFSLTREEKDKIEEKYNIVVNKLRKITKEKRGTHVHDRRYNDKDFLIVDLMERQNKIHKELTGKPKQEYMGKDVYYNVTIIHLDDVQNMIIENNNYIYTIINDFLKEILEIIINQICLHIDKCKKN